MALTQANRAMRVQTPIGPDKLLITKFTGNETISRLFSWQLDLLAENSTKVEFDKLIGQKIAVELELPGGKTRYFHGICNRLSEGKRDSTFTHYKMEVVPQFWLLTRRTQCRIFQQIAIPDILKQVLKGLEVKFELKGKYANRDYCVQYRESDFNFASRLMEEEGIYYYFQHDKKGNTLVLADTPEGHADAPEFNKAIFDDTTGGSRPDMRVFEWEKAQELCSGKLTLWDNCFELPQQHLEAQKTIQESVAVGKVTHKLKVADNDKLELYDYPGAYAQRFDGIDPGGGARPGDLTKIFEDNARVAKLRMEEEAAHSLEIRGDGNCKQFTAGHKFSLEKHFNADGAYVLTSVTHLAKSETNYRSGEGDTLSYDNSFTCIPLALPFRPPMNTPKATVQGTQTATVVGPPGEIIFCDKYARVKVQFHWDRQGKKDANSSCWIRVSQNWGGAGWGGNFIPHVGQEVIVDFEEGDPDRPLIVGRLYNAEAMPPLELPAGKTLSIIRDHGANEIKMQGNPGQQSIRMFSPHANTIFKLGAPNEPFQGFFFQTDEEWNEYVKSNKIQTIDGNKKEVISGSSHTHTEGNVDASVIGDNNYYLKGNYVCKVDGYQEYSTKGHYVTKVFGFNWVVIVGADTNLYLSAQQQISHGTKILINMSKELFKTPDHGSMVGRVKEAYGTLKTDIGDCVTKAGERKDKVVGA